MIVTLPPGSTSADLQAAIDNAAPGDTIIISGDMSFAGSVTITAEKEITIQSDTGNNWIMSSPGTRIRHFLVYGTLTLQHVTLDGSDDGGGVKVDGGEFTMNDAAVIQNCNAGPLAIGFGSGIYMINGTGTMNRGAIIQNCYAGDGGGIFTRSSRFVINGGSIIGNTAVVGGGISAVGNSEFIITDGTISRNTAEQLIGGGGGILASYSTVIISGESYIAENKARATGGGINTSNGTLEIEGRSHVIKNEALNGNGGGINVYNSVVKITGESYIAGNKALNGDGGGIYISTVNPDYENLVTGSEAVFRCNWASEAHVPPQNASELYPDIQFASTSIADHPLNNFDINYTDGMAIPEAFSVFYNANGGTGSHTGPSVVPGSTDVVLPLQQTGISRPGYGFTEWNTQPDGSGESYAPGDAILFDCATTLFAQWMVGREYTITYDCNGGIGHYIDHCREFDIIYIVLSTAQTGINRTGFLFAGWNTEPDGSGISYAQGETINISGDLTLYAQWERIPTQRRLCRTPATKCRTAIEGQKLWVDNNNAGNTRPLSVEILLLRDGEVYRRANVDSAGDGYFGFCCVPVWKNSGQKYNYQVDEVVPGGYTKTIEGYNIINTLTTL